MRRIAAAFAVALAVSSAGCGLGPGVTGRGLPTPKNGQGTGATASGTTTSGPFEVTSFLPRTGPTTTPGLTVVFSHPVSPATLVANPTWFAAEDDDANP